MDDSSRDVVMQDDRELDTPAPRDPSPPAAAAEASTPAPTQAPSQAPPPDVATSAPAPAATPTAAPQLAAPTILPPLPLPTPYARASAAAHSASVPGTPAPVGFVESSGPVTPGITAPAPSEPPSPGAAGRPLNVKDALSYLELVKVKFENWPDVYNNFLDIMKDFKSQVIDTPGVIERVSNLFVGHVSLIQGFNTFLPAGYRIECLNEGGATSVTVTTPEGTTNHYPGGVAMNSLSRAASGAPPLPPLSSIPWAQQNPSPAQHLMAAGPHTPELPHTPSQVGFDPGPQSGVRMPQHNQQRGPEPEFNHAIQFVNVIKVRFNDQPETYKQFLEILQKYQKEQRPYQEVFHQVSQLFTAFPDLIDEFKQFLPDPSGSDQSKQQAFGLLASAGGEMERADKKKPSAAGAAADKSSAPPKRKKRVLEDKIPVKQPVQQPKAKRSKHHHGKPEPQSPPYHAPSPLPSHSAANNASASASHNLANGSAHRDAHMHTQPSHHGASNPTTSLPKVPDESLFFDRVRASFNDKAKYHDFLKLLNMFTQEIIDSTTLVNRVGFFLGGAENAELLQMFKDIVGVDDRDVVLVEDPAGVSGSAGGSGAVLKGNASVVAALDRPRVDLNSCKKYGPSYRKLPKEEVSLACSGRDAMCWEVLNDEWVSHPTWASEDTGFTTHKKNAFEEALHKSEEERHEYDFHVEAITRTIQVLEPIMLRITLMDADERTHFKLKPGLGGQGKSIYQRVIKKVYGKEHGAEIIAALHESPSIAVPVVLNRLKQKDDEWKRAQREWNKVWREVDGRNYYKSLDHQSVNFKTNDKKAWTPKPLISEIEAKRAEQAKERAKFTDPTQARTLPKDHYAFKLDDVGVLQDCVKVILAFVERTTSAQYSRQDKIHLESFLHSFIPLFFMLDPAEFVAGLAPVPDHPPRGITGNGKSAAVDPLAAPPTRGTDEAESADEAASDSQSAIDDADDSTSLASGSHSNSNGRRNGGTHPHTHGGVPSADLRKRLLKSASAKKAAGGGGSSSQPPSRASPSATPGASGSHPQAGEAMAIDTVEGGTAFGTADSEAWVKYTNADPNAKTHAVFKPRVPQAEGEGGVSGRKSNFFANNHIYVMLRQLQTLYSRFHMCKTMAAELAADNSGWHLANPVAVDLGYHDTIGPGNTRLLTSGPNPAKTFYPFTLVCCEKLFANEMETAEFEDNLRFMYDIRAYIMFTLDKLVAATVKQIQTVMQDQRCQELINLLRKERALDSFTTQQLINYRREAENITGPDENLYRICWIVPTAIMQIQLLARDDISTDDAQTLTDRWRQYIESYTLPHQTEGLPEFPVPFLRKSIEEHEEDVEPNFVSRARLQIKVCIRTYRLFFVAGTEDFFWRRRQEGEIEEVRKVAAERRTERKDALAAWLDSKIPRTAAAAAEETAASAESDDAAAAAATSAPKGEDIEMEVQPDAKSEVPASDDAKAVEA